MTATYLSKEALDSVDVPARQAEVLAAIEQLGRDAGRPSDQDIARHLGWTINRVTPRRGELEKAGLIVEAGTKRNAFNRQVQCWRIAPAQLGLFPVKRGS